MKINLTIEHKDGKCSSSCAFLYTYPSNGAQCLLFKEILRPNLSNLYCEGDGDYYICTDCSIVCNNIKLANDVNSN